MPKTTNRIASVLARRVLDLILLASVAMAVALSLGACSTLTSSSPSNDSASAASTAGNTSSTGETIVYDPTSNESTITVAMVGDVLVHQPVWTSGLRSDGSYNFDHLFANLGTNVTGADIRIANQETILGGTQLGLSGYPTFNSPQEVGDAEVAAGFNVILQATNHTLDKGQVGVESDLAFWRTNHPEVAVLGIADSRESYDDIFVYEKDGFRVAVLNYTFGTNGIEVPSDNPYAVHLLDADQITSDVERAKAISDMIVVCPHWGTEYSLTPDESQEQWADLFSSLGVDVVIGSHPHVLEPVETRTNADGDQMVIFWSLGNFVSHQQENPTVVGGLAKVTLTKDALGCRVANYELDPVVTQEASGTSYTTYLLSDYTDELASGNLISGTGFSVQYCKGLCSQVLGDGFDQGSCTLKVALEGALGNAA